MIFMLWCCHGWHLATLFHTWISPLPYPNFIHISFLSTPRNISKTPQNPTKSLTTHPIRSPLSPQTTLQPSAGRCRTTTDIPADRMDDLKMACDLLQEPTNQEFHCSEMTILDHLTVDDAQDLNIPLIFYPMVTASTAVFLWSPEFLAGESRRHARPPPAHMAAPPDWVDFPSQVAVREYEAVALHNLLYGPSPTGIEDGARVAKLV